MMATKVCGITNIADAQCALEFGAAAIGFIFYDKSPRAITIKKAKFISDHLPDKTIKLGVFVDQSMPFILEAVQNVPLNIIQLHGDESPEFCEQFQLPVIKALHIRNSGSFSIMNDYNVDAFLFDTFSKDKYGGTGETFDWSLFINPTDKPIILSGGLNSENVLKAIKLMKPDAIDLNSGLEKSPGIKDHLKIKLFFKNIRDTVTNFNVFSGLLKS
tara:strand:+ start:1640 stop:2287 length:648 start_codon:yes stop_codon:yes gene_type:complete